MNQPATSRSGANSKLWHRAAILSLAVLMCSGSLETQADSLRCGRKVVRTGDPDKLLLKHCGQPQSASSGQATVRLPGGAREVRVKQWYYQKSSRSLLQVVLIYQGRVVAIRNGGR